MAEAEPGSETVDLAERRLLVRHAAGDETAFAELLAAWRRPVFGFLVRSGVEASMRDDLFQDIFIKVHGAAASYQPSRPLKPWLFTIVANTVRSHFRRAVPKTVEMGSPEAPELSDPAPGPDRAFEAGDDAAFLERTLPSLPEAQREVLLLTVIEGLDQNQVSTALGIPVNTVKTHLRRGRLALARALAGRHEVRR